MLYIIFYYENNLKFTWLKLLFWKFFISLTHFADFILCWEKVFERMKP